MMRWFTRRYTLGAVALCGALLAACGAPATDTDTDTSPIPATAASATVAPATVEPATIEPTTVEPTTVEPTTVEPTTVEPTTVVPVATETDVIDLTQLPSPTPLPDPTALPAPTALPTPTLPPLPTDPATEPTVDPAALPLYLWPDSVPESLTIDPEQSAADETGFVLELSDAGGELNATILGGGYVTAPPLDEAPFGAEEVSIRGNEGYAFSTGGGWSLAWREQGTRISIEGVIPREMAFTLAEALEPVELETWQERLGQAAP
jgi:hypothetical protein